ncbi:MAG: response regulator transcription factor [Clostridiales bacterium]|jgi:DNA-binding LytR/AlgR family response regulator|nr:response regulator transcription factor [Clostridiales bacterium]
MKIMIVDDEQLVLDNLKYILKQFSEIEIVYETTNSLDAVEQLGKLYIDAIFVDIAMPNVNGMEMAEKAYNINPNIKTVFITAYDIYALDAFRVNAFDYILKPVTTSKLKRTIDKLCHHINSSITQVDTTDQKDDKDVVKITGLYKNRYVVTDSSDGLFIKIMQRDILLHTQNCEYILKHNMNYWEDKLKGFGWYRCHRGYLININKVESIYPMFNSTYNIRIKGSDEEIPVSRSYIAEFKLLFNL